jgi:cytosine/uracil/thiamine/allantoin permease
VPWQRIFKTIQVLVCFNSTLKQLNMKKYSFLAIIALISTTLSSCELVEGIFKAGVWSGVIIVVIILALIIWLISKVFGGKG